MKTHQYFVYILANKVNTVFYVCVTSNLQTRVWQHKNKIYKGFTSKYNCDKLVYFEDYNQVDVAIGREKQLKAGSRKKKIDLVLSLNLGWNDLSADWYIDY